MNVVRAAKASKFATRAEAEDAAKLAPAGRETAIHEFKGEFWVEVKTARGPRSALRVA